jgi:hypothetical protein
MTLGRKITLALTLTLALLAGLFFLRLATTKAAPERTANPAHPSRTSDHAPNRPQPDPAATPPHGFPHTRTRPDSHQGPSARRFPRRGHPPRRLISAEDWIEINAEGTRRKPSDLLNFGDPRPIAVTPDGQGNGLLDLQALAPAAAYRIEALRPADGAWYAHDFIPEQGKVPTADRLDDLGDIPPTLPHRNRASLHQRASRSRRLRGHPSTTAEPGNREGRQRALRLVERSAPTSSTPCARRVPSSRTHRDPLRLAPLPPDPSIRVHFRTLTGVDGNFSDFPLRPQQVLPVTVNLAAIFRDVPPGRLC